MQSSNLLKIFIGLSIIYLINVTVGRVNIAWFLKPFLLPLLLIAVKLHNDFLSKKLLLTALLFSWIGELFLLFAAMADIYFIGGFIAFLLSYIFYIL
ncbi:putative membrane protein YhhN [Flavobacterium sp. PL11]|jgi:uncharacterized membrane protein YhhN|uniref:lysoplasmalogenase family protein n=1 Tax=Flavobacterium sp. PL11 TaxID=3071717 RepID=UPI002E007E3F|nr:putative membrane protein YhhN [Flavobacterium sp. PL11]